MSRLGLQGRRAPGTVERFEGDLGQDLEFRLSELLGEAQVGGEPWFDIISPDALANAVPYLQAFGHTVLAWIWLDVALAAQVAPASAARTGRLGAMRFFFHYELPKIGAWLQVVSSRDQTCAALPEEAF